MVENYKIGGFGVILSVLIGVILTGVQASGVGHAARVLELSERFLEVRKDGVWLVKFYAPWCGHCKKLEPIFNHVAQALHDTNIRVAKVDCTRFPTVASEFNVRGYPTIMFISGNRINIYNGERITQDIVDYAKKMNGPHITETSLDPYDIDGHLFGYYGPKSDPLWLEFETVAKDNQDTDRYYHFTSQLESTPHVINKKSNGLVLNVTEVARVKAFVASHRFDPFVRLTRSNFYRFIQTKKWVVIGVIDEDKLGRSPDHHLEFRDVLETLADNVDFQRFQLAWTTAVDFMAKFVTSELETPYLLVINSSNYEHYFLHEEKKGWSNERILTYLEVVSQGGGRAYGGDT
ncbi:unnamed protein product, partial [Allacma fusca]